MSNSPCGVEAGVRARPPPGAAAGRCRRRAACAACRRGPCRRTRGGRVVVDRPAGGRRSASIGVDVAPLQAGHHVGDGRHLLVEHAVAQPLRPLDVLARDGEPHLEGADAAQNGPEAGRPRRRLRRRCGARPRGSPAAVARALQAARGAPPCGRRRGGGQRPGRHGRAVDARGGAVRAARPARPAPPPPAPARMLDHSVSTAFCDNVTAVCHERRRVRRRRRFAGCAGPPSASARLRLVDGLGDASRPCRPRARAGGPPRRRWR